MTVASGTSADLEILDLRDRADLMGHAVEWHYDGWGVEAKRTREEIDGLASAYEHALRGA